MGRPASPIKLTKHNIALFEGDFDKMQALFPSLGASHAIRTLTRKFLARVESTPSKIDINIETEVEIGDE